MGSNIENSLYDFYHHPSSFITSPTSPEAFGVKVIPRQYPWSFTHERGISSTEEAFEGSDKQRVVRFRDKLIEEDETESFFQSITPESASSRLIRTPSALYKESILAQTTPKKRTPSSSSRVIPTSNTSSSNASSSSFLSDNLSPIGLRNLTTPSFLRTPPSMYHTSYSQQSSSLRDNNTFANLKRPSQLSLSRFDEKVRLKEIPSIMTNFDPDKDKKFYGQAVGIYKSFSRNLNDNDDGGDDKHKQRELIL
ncbi:14447_t:CDS:2 [Ambispora leptoticha]|uniref:14447_t:CDS:1 n=1 Tax=Ambispora leptoticha TaxID=144679 RepID=A0A9N8ZB07_9GLOM|nr:14447_t:CDS:2 [Ambispora leptoticha]